MEKIKLNRVPHNFSETLERISSLLSDFLGIKVTYIQNKSSDEESEINITVQPLSRTKDFNTNIVLPLINSANKCIESYCNQFDKITDLELLSFINDLCINLIFPNYFSLESNEKYKHNSFLRDLQDVSVKTYESQKVNIGLILIKEDLKANELITELNIDFIEIDNTPLVTLLNNEKPLIKLIDSQSIVLVINNKYDVVGFARKKTNTLSISQYIHTLLENKEVNSLYSSLITTLNEMTIEVSTKRKR